MELNAPILGQWMDFDLLSRLGVAVLLGLALGLDRQIHGHAAGLRTHGIVCFTSSAMTVSIIALFNQLEGLRMDPLRVFEAMGAFIGIIGAAMIIFSKGEVKNVTTAVNLWLTAVIGIACGAAQWPLVAIAAIISLIVLTVLRVIEAKLFPHAERNSQ